jgi:hypothetical protein
MKKTQIPMARKEGLVIQEMPDELLVYDLETNKAHCLNETAYSVWKACDGKNTVADIAALFENGSEDLVWLAIDQLNENDLLEREYRLDLNGRTRRDLIKKVGLASVIALPVVASLTAPSSALAAASCACTTPTSCVTQPACPSTNNCAPTGVCSP